LSEGTILGSSLAFFLPETLQNQIAISGIRYAALLWMGLFFLYIGVILIEKGETNNED
jgi:hypothetical protein